MKTGVALVAVSVVGIGAFLLLRKKGIGAGRGNRDLAATQLTVGSGVAAKSGVGHFVYNSATPTPSVAGLSGGAPGGGFSLTGVATGIASKYANSIIPGTGGAVGTAATAAGSLLKKIPGLGSLGSKLKFW